MTLAYSAPLRAPLRLVEPPRPRLANERRGIPAGHPRALSWDLLPWEEDDWAWYAVEHRGPLDLEEVGELLGLDESMVRDIEESALTKLQALNPELTPGALRAVFERYDADRHEERRKVERAAAEKLMEAFAGAAE